MRVSDLAKLVDASSKEVIQVLEQLGHTKKKHMSTVDEDVATQVIVIFDQRKLEVRAVKEEEERKIREAEEEKQREEDARRRRDEEERRRLEEEERRARESDEQLQAELEAARLKEEQERQKTLEPQPAQTAVPTPQAVKPETPAATDDKTREKKKRRGKGEEKLVVPQIEVMKIEKGRRKKGAKGAKHPDSQERKKFKPTKIFTDEDIYVSKPSRAKKSRQKTDHYQHETTSTPHIPAGKSQTISIKGDVTVGQFAEKIGVPSMEIIKKLMLEGVMLTINQIMPPDWCELLAEEYGLELDLTPESDEADVEPYIVDPKQENLAPRPPVVTIMGHVDHGKTTLLDYIRKSRVAEQEFGAITQHIGAYHVVTPRGPITFLDTPGHEAFTSMRARGVQLTDIVILVVAANDGVMPQTIEAINHTKSAKVPLIVAINKVDLPDANVAKVKQELMKYELIGEDLGGDTIMVEVSAKKGQNIDQLLEMTLLQAEVLELKTDPTTPAMGVVIESHMDANRGPLASVLITQGTLHQGDHFVAGAAAGRARVLLDDFNKPVNEVKPGFPVEILGFETVPQVGDEFHIVPDERVSRAIAEKRQMRHRFRSDSDTSKSVSLDTLHEMVESGDLKELNVILKADVQGSAEAIRQSMESIGTEKVSIKIVHQAVGGILESDVGLAQATGAIILGFNVRPTPQAAELAEREKIDIRLYRIIYDLIEDMKSAIAGLLEPVFKETTTGRAQVKQVFKVTGVGNVAGSMVLEGEVVKGRKARVVRNNIVVYEGEIISLRRVKDDVNKVASGTECGIGLKNFNDVKSGDTIECYTVEEIPQTVS